MAQQLSAFITVEKQIASPVIGATIAVSCFRVVSEEALPLMNSSVASRNSGVTFVELMIVLVIVGILAGLAGPQYGALMKKQTLLSESRRITSLLKLARSEARSRGAFVTVSRIASNDWSGTIQVYENMDNGDDAYDDINTAGDDSLVDDLIRRVSSSGRIVSASASVDSNFLTFTPRGWAKVAFDIAVCASATDSTAGRFITVNRVGKITEGPIEESESCAQ